MTPSSRREFPATQARSQETRDRLLDAAEALLSEEGVDAATAPAIAERAGVAVGSLYRRFHDKDAILQAVYVRFFERSKLRNRDGLSPERWRDLPAHTIVTELVSAMVGAYSQRRKLLSALIHFADNHPDAAFRRHADEARQEAFTAIASLLLERRSQIHHPDPEHAIQFALTVIGATLKHLVLQRARSIDCDEVSSELSLMVSRYLGLRPAAR